MSCDQENKMIQIHNLNKKFGENVIFRDFNLDVASGEYVVLEGKSGHGKTTFLNIIGAVEPYDAGTVIVDGVNVAIKKNHITYFRDHVSFLFQNFALIENKTVLQNLLLVKKKGVDKNKIISELRRFDLAAKIDQKIYTLSGGEQQRIALIRLILQDNPVILADEPTGSLDRENGEFVLKVLKELNKSGKTILMVTHDDNVKKQGDRIVSL